MFNDLEAVNNISNIYYEIGPSIYCKTQPLQIVVHLCRTNKYTADPLDVWQICASGMKNSTVLELKRQLAEAPNERVC